MKIVTGMFETQAGAEDAIRRLQDAGFSIDTLGVAMRDTGQASELAAATGAEELETDAATAGAVSGAGLGFLLGLALVGTTIVIPGVGAFLIGGSLATGAITAAGTTVAGLAGAGLGAAAGGMIGNLVQYGIAEHEAHEIAEKLEQGHILVTVNAEDEHAPLARTVLAQEGARQP